MVPRLNSDIRQPGLDMEVGHRKSGLQPTKNAKVTGSPIRPSPLKCKKPRSENREFFNNQAEIQPENREFFNNQAEIRNSGLRALQWPL